MRICCQRAGALARNNGTCNNKQLQQITVATNNSFRLYAWQQGTITAIAAIGCRLYGCTVASGSAFVARGQWRGAH